MNHTGLRMRVLVIASLIVAVGATAFSQTAPANSDSVQVIQFLNQTIDWYRNMSSVQQAAAEPDDLPVVSDNARMADQIVQLAFEFARGEAEIISQRRKSGQNQSQSTGSSEYPALLQLEDKIDKQIQETQSELATLRQKMEAATGKKRQQLQTQIAETQGELELAQARSDAMHNMAVFVRGASSNRPGVTGLQTQIEALAASVPAVSAPSTSSETAPSSKEQLHPAPVVPANKPTSSGIWDLTADLLVLSQKVHTVEVAIQQTNVLARKSAEIRAPLVGRLKELTNQGDELANQADSANQSELGQEKQQLDALAAQFRQISAASIPLSKQKILLELYQKSLDNWGNTLRSRRSAELKGVLVRLALLALILASVIAAAELWRRAVYRYIHEPRLRYQFLLARKVVLWFLIAVIVAFAFASRLGSVVTFAGLITAGLAVALQSVILAVLGYFLLIGKFGLRVGDRVQIGGVTGEVIDVGLLRLHLMELGKAGDDIPTGRVVAFANSIVFQPTAGLFKQIRGTNFLWHEITLTLSTDTDYSELKKRLLKVVEGVLADYRNDMERQYQAMQTTFTSGSINSLRPTIRLRFTQSGVEVMIRFPADRQQAAEIDERVTLELQKELDREPKLKLAGSGSGPSIMVKTDLADG